MRWISTSPNELAVLSSEIEGSVNSAGSARGIYFASSTGSLDSARDDVQKGFEKGSSRPRTGVQSAGST